MYTQRDRAVLSATAGASSDENLCLTHRVAATEGEAGRTATVVAGPVAEAAGPVVAQLGWPTFSFRVVK